MISKIIDFKTNGSDDIGMLVSLEELKNIPFTIKRIYYIYNVPTGVRRGFHAHKKLKQVLICLHGSCKIHLDNGFETEEVILSSPSKGLGIEHNVWREMYDFQEGTVLMVVASELYDESDYIRDYDDYVSCVRR